MKRVLTTLLKSVCIIALVLCGMDAQAQGNLVTGAVRDAKGEPVIGATVIVKGTATGATSGADGRYSIQAGPDATLEFSFIGYKKQEVPVGTRSAIDVVLEEDALMVDDVVVIGYGTQSRRTITAAVSKVDGEKLAGAPVNSIGDALKGRVGGVRVSSADNQPGSDPVFLIRGGSSINQSNAPIIIIDGVNREMTGLNPNDIESIEVLKDAASAGIYGARASNGVILITTKKGSMARGPQVTFEAQAAWTSPAVRFDLMDGGDYLRTMRTMLNEYPSTYAYGSGILTGANSAGIGNGDNSVWTPKFVDTPADVPAGWKVMVDPIDHSKLIAYQDNDQQKQWFDDSYWMNYYVGVNGGNDKVQYAASAGYTKDGGIGINTDFSRFTFHGNTSFKILRNLKATTVFDYSETKGNTLPSSGIATYWTTVGRGMFMPATHRDYLDDGTPAQGTNNTTISAAWFDRYYTSNYTARRMTANFNLEWEIVDGLRAVMQVANHNYYRIDNQRLAGNAISNQRRTYEKWGQTNRFSTQGYLNYMCPGYIQLGAASDNADGQPGNLISPVLNIPAGYDLLLTCKVAIWAAAPDQGMVGICEKNDGFWIPKGTLDKIVASTKSYVSLDIPAYTWVEVTAVIPNPGAKANLAFFISTADSWFSGSSVKAGRWYIDDIKLVY